MDHENATDRFIALKDVMHLTSISRSHVYSLIKRNAFPAPYDLSGQTPNRCSRWSYQEVIDWVESKKLAREKQSCV